MRHFHALMGWAVCVLGSYCLTQPTFAAESRDDRVTVLEEKLDRSLKLIEQLTVRMQELEAQLANKGTAAAPAQAPAAAASSPQTQARLENVEEQLAQLTDANAARGGGGPGVPLHGFADIGIGNHNANEPELKGANVGSLDIFLNPQLGEHTRSLFELTFEVDEHGHVDADLERAQLGYQFSDAATLWIGRFHTPFGYYNTAFHHGQQIATSLRRPRFLLFEDQGGVMPNHTVGAWLTGADHLSDGKLTYDLFVGNGQGISSGSIDAHAGGVDHGGAIYGGNLGYLFGDTLDGLKVGVSAFRSNISDDQQVGRITRVDNAGVYFAYDTDRFEHIGEFYRFNDSDRTFGGPAHRSSAGFLQLGWRLPLAMPYLRYERAVLDQNDNYFALQAEGMSYFRTAVGVRFDLDAKSALKLEFARTRNTDRLIEQWNDAMLDYAIRF
ncbi:MAG: hypothetical protein QOG17_1005 [Gammaproteobacteria bacterium]|nr:hypothetical protein [Gammaproteobacteria bacterium]